MDLAGQLPAAVLAELLHLHPTTAVHWVAIAGGDWVVVRHQEEAENGEIVAAMVENEATVKTLKRSDGHVWLMPHNPAYTPILGDEATILGKVVAVLRRV